MIGQAFCLIPSLGPFWSISLSVQESARSGFEWRKGEIQPGSMINGYYVQKHFREV